MIKKISVLLIVSILIIGCGKSSQLLNPSVPGKDIVLGDTSVRALEVSGITLSGPLAGKKAYILDTDINFPNCWMDSVHWTGSELFYGLTSIDFSNLLANASFEYKSICNLPEDQVDGDFDIYVAKPVAGEWQLANQNVNTDVSDAGMSISAEKIAFTRYFAPPESWDIYFADRVTINAWSEPVAYDHNSICKEDNPEIYANATKMIFESNRSDAVGSSCNDEDAMKLWFSEKITGYWSTPNLIAGIPNEGEKNTQPWVDESEGYLYWTDDKGCNCVRRISFDGKTVTGDAQDVVVPNISSLADGTADGEVVFLGEYSQDDNNAFIACAVAKAGGPFMDQWSIDINLCVIPLSD
jgi:hypothetical protein